jgi:hypothetical protein
MALAAIALGVGATTHVSTGYGLAAVWIAVLGIGIGIGMALALNAALEALSEERAGAGSGLMQAVRQVGGTLGVAVLGTVLGSSYRSRLHTGHLPAPLSEAVHESVNAGVEVAHQLDDKSLEAVVRAAFVHGLDLTLAVCGAVVFVGAIAAALYMPGRAAAVTDREAVQEGATREHTD